MTWLIWADGSHLLSRAETRSRAISWSSGRAHELAQPKLVQYPDHWWGDEFWQELKKAGMYSHWIGDIDLPEPPDEEVTRAELKAILEFRNAADFGERLPEIIEENAGPPAYYHRMLLTDQERNKLTGALLSTAIVWALPFIMYFKHKWKRARPMQFEARIRPVVDCPAHPAYPSGHSTQSHLVALAMGQVTGRQDIKDALWSAADRIAQNREYAGLHYPSDSRCGALLAQKLLPLFLSEFAKSVEQARQEEWNWSFLTSN